MTNIPYQSYIPVKWFHIDCKRCYTKFYYSLNDSVQESAITGRRYVICPNCFKYIHIN